jgi:hypothetical protein
MFQGPDPSNEVVVRLGELSASVQHLLRDPGGRLTTVAVSIYAAATSAAPLGAASNSVIRINGTYEASA